MQETNQETKDTSLFTEITAEESASVNGAHSYYRNRNRYRYYASRRRGGCDNYGYNPYFDGRPVSGYVHNTSHGSYY
jgi:hypothetical protein